MNACQTHRASAAIVTAGLWLIATGAAAQRDAAADYPTRPIRMLCGFSAGGGSDFAARIVGAKLHEIFGQTVVIDNRTGANGAIAGEITARAPADGYTIMMLAVAQATGAASGIKLPYDLLRDFVAVSQATQQPYLVVITPSVAARNVSEFIALAKAKPGQLSYASTGVAGSNHLAAELFSRAAGIRMLHVPYKGPPPALADVAGGQVQFMISSIQTSLPLARGGKLRALAVTSEKRSHAAPEIPPVSDTLPGFQLAGWYGVLAPAATPPRIVDKLGAAIAQGMQTPETKARVATDGSEAVGSLPKDFDRFLRSEMVRFAKVIKDAGLRGSE
jgi:tripartite-type tricarboxylate transporter receptor subunit TctC